MIFLFWMSRLQSSTALSPQEISEFKEHVKHSPAMLCTCDQDNRNQPTLLHYFVAGPHKNISIVNFLICMFNLLV